MQSLGTRVGWTVAILLLTRSAIEAGDWPQILGPSRNGIAGGETLGTGWPPEGPPLLWTRQVGRGYAGAAIRGDLAVLFYRSSEGGRDEEVIEAVRPQSGESVWKVGLKAHFAPSIFPAEDGPLCVPLLTENRAFVFGGGGDLAAIDTMRGKILWKRDLYREYRTRGGSIDFGYFGAGASPILEGNRLLVNVGGRPAAGIVALDPVTGKNLWTATEEGASYSSPIACTVAGERHVIFITRYHTVSLDPEDGRVRFRFPFGRRGPTVNAASPLVSGNLLFTTASYGVGSRLTRLTATGAEEVWATDRGFASQYNTPVLHQGHLYGTDGRADVGTASLRCVELASGKTVWEEPNFGVASVTLVGDWLLILRADGMLIRAAASSSGFRPEASFRISRGTFRALPALADGRLLIRDGEQFYCYGIGPQHQR